MRLFKALTWLILPALFASGQVLLKDAPEKGEWDFSPEKAWETFKAGDNDFGNIAELLIPGNGRIYARDFKRNVSYIFDENGAFLKEFAPQGKEAGQLPYYLNRFQAGDKIVLAAPDKLHYFFAEGGFERAVDNNLFLRFPLGFLNENEFIFAPNLPQSPAHERKLMVRDLASDRERILVDLSKTGSGADDSVKGPMLMIPDLTPQMRIGLDRGNMVFGRSDRYEIFLADPSGAISSSFRLDRKPMKASDEYKRGLLAEIGLPAEQKEKILAQLPGEMNLFSRVEFVDALVYVYAVTEAGNAVESQTIDIFDGKGRYLYRGVMKFGEGLKFSGFSNLVIRDGCAYVVLKDGQGRQILSKFRIKLPKTA